MYWGGVQNLSCVYAALYVAGCTQEDSSLLTIEFGGTTPCNVSLSVNDRSVILNEDCGDSEVNCKPFYHMEGSAHFRLECRDTGPQIACFCC